MMNTTPNCSPPPVNQPVDCPQPPVLSPVTKTNQNIYVDSSVSDATLTSLPPSDSDVSLSNATSNQTSGHDFSLSCGTSRQTSDYESSRSRSNLRNNSNTECPQPPVVIPEGPRPPIVIKECPVPFQIPECPLPPMVIKECPMPPMIQECPLPPIVIKECPRPPPVVTNECSIRSRRAIKTRPSRSKNAIEACPSRSNNAIEACPSRSNNAIEACPSRSNNAIEACPSRSNNAIEACSSRSKNAIEANPSRANNAIEVCSSRSKNAIKECPRRSQKVIPGCTRSSKRVISECTRSSKRLIPECTRSSKKVIPECTRSSKKIIPECTRSSKKVIEECPLPLVVVPQSIQCLRPPVTTGSLRSNVISTQSTNCDRSLSKVPTQQACSALDNSGSAVVNEKESLLRSQSEPALGQNSQTQSKVAPVKSSHSQINFELIRSESRLTLEKSLSEVLKPGLSGLKEFMSSSLLNTGKGSSFLESDLPHLNKFIDFFIECDGLRYMGILEQIEYDFEDRIKAALLNARPNTQAEAQYLRDKLVNIGKVQPAYQQISLKEIDFPELLNKEMKILSFDYETKIDAIRHIHVYGLQMEKYWLTQLNTGKNVGKVEVYDIGTQILAELMAQLFSLLVKSCEFLMEVNEDVKMFTGKLSAESLIHLFTEFRRLLVEEVGAVGETCGSVMVHIPYLKDDDIIEIMTKLYNQVNFVDICICRALKPVVPLVMLFDCQRVSATTYSYT